MHTNHRHYRQEPGRVNLAGKVKNLFLVTIDVYRLENRKIEVCQLSEGHGGLGAPGNGKYLARDTYINDSFNGPKLKPPGW